MLSIVIPVFNERESLRRLARRTGRSGRAPTATIWKSSSSTTARPTARGRRFASWPSDDPRVRGIRFRRNFGKAAALSAGFEAARGELVMTLDADLQDDPREIPRFLAAIAERARRGQRLEAGPPRSLAQGAARRASSTGWSAG